MKIRDDGEIQSLIAQISRIQGDEAQLRALLDLLRDNLSVPFEARVVGVPVQVQAIRFDGNPRRGLVATVRREGRPFDVGLVDVWLEGTSRAGRLLAAYRAWAGIPDRSMPLPVLRPPVLPEWDKEETGPILDVVVLGARTEAARVRMLGGNEELILRTPLAADFVPGEIVSMRPRQRATWRNQRIVSGDVLSRRTDVASLRLVPLGLREHGMWDPMDEYPGEPGQPILPCYAPIIQAGPRSAFELTPPLGARDGVRSGETDPILRAIFLSKEGQVARARHVLMDVLSRDLRCLDAHAWLGHFRFLDDPMKALAHYRIGIAIAELTIHPRFAGVLPWRFVDNHPLLRCVFGAGMAQWRLGQPREALAALNRLLWFDPGDEQGARHVVARIRAGHAWQGEPVIPA